MRVEIRHLNGVLNSIALHGANIYFSHITISYLWLLMKSANCLMQIANIHRRLTV